MKILKKIISGGQTGADIAGIDAAMKEDFPYGGWLPRGRKTEAGKLPEKYLMEEMPSGGYPKRTEQNIKDSDGTVIFTHTKKLKGGSKLTADLAESWGKPWLHVNLIGVLPGQVVSTISEWIQKNQIEILNVAGSRASKDPEIYKKVFYVIQELIKAP